MAEQIAELLRNSGLNLLFIAFLSMAALLLSSPKAIGLTFLQPYCTEEEAGFYLPAELAGGLRLIQVITPDARASSHYDRIVLASCETNRQVIVDTGGADLDFLWARAELFRMVASSEVFTFEEVVKKISIGGIRAKIDVIGPNSCSCAIVE